MRINTYVPPVTNTTKSNPSTTIKPITVTPKVVAPIADTRTANEISKSVTTDNLNKYGAVGYVQEMGNGDLPHESMKSSIGKYALKASNALSVVAGGTSAVAVLTAATGIGAGLTPALLGIAGLSNIASIAVSGVALYTQAMSLEDFYISSGLAVLSGGLGKFSGTLGKGFKSSKTLEEALKNGLTSLQLSNFMKARAFSIGGGVKGFADLID